MRRLIATATSIWIAALTLTSGQRPIDPRELRNHTKFSYLTASVSDPVAQLNERIRQGQVRFDVEPSRGYLRSVLTALDVPVESQALVFSKTSFQASRISPQNPRAIYFNDRVSVGWVRGGGFYRFAREQRASLDHMLYDVGFDYRVENGAVRILKSGFYGVF